MTRVDPASHTLSAGGRCQLPEPIKEKQLKEKGNVPQQNETHNKMIHALSTMHWIMFGIILTSFKAF